MRKRKLTSEKTGGIIFFGLKLSKREREYSRGFPPRKRRCVWSKIALRLVVLPSCQTQMHPTVVEFISTFTNQKIRTNSRLKKGVRDSENQTLSSNNRPYFCMFRQHQCWNTIRFEINIFESHCRCTDNNLLCH